MENSYQISFLVSVESIVNVACGKKRWLEECIVRNLGADKWFAIIISIFKRSSHPQELISSVLLSLCPLATAFFNCGSLAIHIENKVVDFIQDWQFSKGQRIRKTERSGYKFWLSTKMTENILRHKPDNLGKYRKKPLSARPW